jgi:anti-sigma B factor antagonist
LTHLSGRLYNPRLDAHARVCEREGKTKFVSLAAESEEQGQQADRESSARDAQSGTEVEGTRLTTHLRPATPGDGGAAGTTVLLEVNGEIDLSTVSVLKQAVLQAAEQSTTGHVIIEMSGVSYMDSSGYGTLLSATKNLRSRGGGVHLIGYSAPIERMLYITRLNTIFGLHASEADALRAIAASPVVSGPAPG